MRRLGRLGSAALVGPAVLLIAACGHSAPAPASPATAGTAQTAAAGGATVPSALTATPGSTTGSTGVGSDQLNQFDNQIGNQINQIDNQIGQANQGLATSEGDPTQ
ncbi:MAG: hypothetical protein ACLQGJ_07780 [Candidatus Dormibacteria bacterium]